MDVRPQAAQGRPADRDPVATGLSFDPWDFESRLAWMLGSPRTGSTWLLRLLVHPWRLYPREKADRSKLDFQGGGRLGRARGPSIVPIAEPYFPRHLTPFVPIANWDKGRHGPEDHLLNKQHADCVSYCLSDAYEDVWRPELRRLILVRLHAQAAQAERTLGMEAPLVLVKEPNGSYGAEFLMSLLPSAKLIFLFRDGRDVVDSQLSPRTTFGPMRRRTGAINTDQERLAFVRTQSQLWVNNMTAVERAYAAHAPELRTRVRYEDLRADTFHTLTPLIAWLGTDRTEDQIRKAVEDNAFEAIPRIKRGKGRLRRAATPGLWRENLKPNEQRIANEIMGETLTSLGYEV